MLGMKTVHDRVIGMMIIRMITGQLSRRLLISSPYSKSQAKGNFPHVTVPMNMIRASMVITATPTLIGGLGFDIPGSLLA